MNHKKIPSSQEDSPPKKPSTWVFDEHMGWINVDDFLSKITKLSNKLAPKRKIEK